MLKLGDMSKMTKNLIGININANNAFEAILKDCIEHNEKFFDPEWDHTEMKLYLEENAKFRPQNKFIVPAEFHEDYMAAKMAAEAIDVHVSEETRQENLRRRSLYKNLDLS